MAALGYIGLAQFLIATALLIFASYSDHKLRKVSDVIWVIMGLSAMVFLAIYYFESNSFVEISLGLMPILGLLTYFLICDWLVDFEEGELNFPWAAIIAIVILIIIAQAYWLGFETTQLILISLFFLVFIILEVIMLHQDYAHYKSNIDESESEHIKGGSVSTSAAPQSKKPEKISVKSTEKPEEDKDVKTSFITIGSWIILVLILAHLTASLILYHAFITNDILKFYTGIFGIVIPIIVLALYLVFFDWKLFPEPTHEASEANSSKRSDDEHKKELDEPILIFRQRSLIEKLGWAFIVIIGFMLVLNAVAYSQDNYLPKHYLASFSVQVWIVIFYGFYNLGIPKGGADTKALMALAVLFPTFVYYEPALIFTTIERLIEDLPGFEYFFTFTLSVLINATIITVFIPVALLFYNVSKGNVKFPQCFFGYKMDLKKVLKSHVWLMEYVDDEGEHKTVLFPRSGETESSEVTKLKKKGMKNVWVTPKIPFIIPMTIGFFMNFIVGNILFVIIFAGSGL
jgi:preflagellin peptidase FlaK